MKNNAPRYVVMAFRQVEKEQFATDEDVLALSRRYLDKNREAYLELAT
jgi:antitoxin Phd